MNDIIEKSINQLSTFNELANKDPKDICQTALCTYDVRMNCYILPVWGEDYRIHPQEGKIIKLQNNKIVDDEFFIIFIINYLLHAKKTQIQNEWISEKDIIGGPIFFRGMHTIPTHYISKRFENDFQSFNILCRQLNGQSIDMADASYRFMVVPRIPILIQFWKADDDFSAECKMLFDKSISEHLDLEIIFSLSVMACKKILKRKNSLKQDFIT